MSEQGKRVRPTAPGSVVVNGQKLPRVGAKGRASIAYSVELNRKRAEHWAQRQREARGPAACEHCGAQPCGHLWTAPDRPVPRGERCCGQCSHDPVPGWTHTHTAWTEGHHHPVHAVAMREGEQVFLRRDGVVLFLQLLSHDERAGKELPRVVYLGQPAEKAALFAADDGGAEVDGWSDRGPVDVLWLAGRGIVAARQTAERVATMNAAFDRSQAARDEQERAEAVQLQQLQESSAAEAQANRSRVAAAMAERKGQPVERPSVAPIAVASETEGEPLELPPRRKTSQRKKLAIRRTARAQKTRRQRLLQGRTGRGSGKVSGS